MPSLVTVARFFAALPTAETLIGLAITVAFLVLVADWRISLLALAVQYILVAVLLSTVVRLEIALVRVIAGVLAAAILYISARTQDQLARRGWREAGILPPAAFVGSWPLRTVALVLVAATVIGLVGQTSFLNTPVLFWLLGLWMMASGMLLMILARDVIKLGLGLLTFSAGFGALYLLIDPGFTVYGLLNIGDLLIALAIAHLAGAPQSEHGQRRHGEG